MLYFSVLCCALLRYANLCYDMLIFSAENLSWGNRTENGLDPNRDFPYHQKPEQCMTTITARSVQRSLFVPEDQTSQARYLAIAHDRPYCRGLRIRHSLGSDAMRYSIVQRQIIAGKCESLSIPMQCGPVLV